MSEETKKTSEEQEAEKEIPVTDGDQEEENLTPEGEDLPEEENNTPGEEAASEDKKEEKSKTSFFGKKKKDKSEQKVEELTDRLKRTMAEFDNFRKRTEKEKSSMYIIGAKEIVEKILPVVDNFERGLAQAQEGDAFADGMKMIYKQLTTTLDELGVKPIEAVGKEFNPDFHNAVMHVEDENFGENIVAEELQKGYPEDIRLKKIAARLMKMAQSGQYNFPRCNKRKEYVASHLALSEFMSVSMSLVYLLNHSYRPYYKWVHRGLLSLPVLGKAAYDKMQRLSVLSLEKDYKEMEWIIEEFCVDCVKELKKQELTSSSEAFLLLQGPEVLKRIKEPALRNSNPWVE